MTSDDRGMVTPSEKNGVYSDPASASLNAQISFVVLLEAEFDPFADISQIRYASCREVLLQRISVQEGACRRIVREGLNKAQNNDQDSVGSTNECV
jgi:hypothetical protein